MFFWSSVECVGGLFKPVRSGRAEHGEGLSGDYRLYDVTTGGSGEEPEIGSEVEVMCKRMSKGRAASRCCVCSMSRPSLARATRSHRICSRYLRRRLSSLRNEIDIFLAKLVRPLLYLGSYNV